MGLHFSGRQSNFPRGNITVCHACVFCHGGSPTKIKLETIADYSQTSCISRSLIDNEIVDHSDVVEASPVGAAPTTASFSTKHRASMDWAETTARRDEKYHDDVIKWKHFPRYWPFVRGIHWSPVNSPHKGQWRGALMFSFLWSASE